MELLSSFETMLLCCLWTDVSGFNLDVKWPLWHNGPADSFFGYSVALHREDDTNWLLVGAPKDSSDGPLNIANGGNMYKCPTAPLSEDIGECEKVVLDASGNTREFLKSNQFMGATVRSSGIDGNVLACAPHFVWKTTDKNDENLREPVGRCVVTDSSFSVTDEYIPCKTDSVEDRGIARITHCQAGFSAELLNDGGKMVLGAPGSYYMQGQLYLKSGSDEVHTQEGANERDDNYRGFAISHGEFTEDDQADIVSGAPRAMYLQGQVEVFSSDLKTLYNFSGDQLGSYFGASVITADVNGDGYDDVIAGAPMYSDKRAGYQDNWECGKVTVYYQESNTAQRELSLFKQDSDHILGSRKQARFGYSLASLGDINYDGYDDIAVGAPYDGEDGEGLVYIFNGNATGLYLQPTQILSAEALGHPDVRTFGFSLAGRLDADGNNYADLLIGSQESSKVVLVRSRPVVKMSPVLTLTPEGLNLEEKDYQLDSGTMVTSFLVRLCFNYRGSYIPETLDIEYTINMDTLYTFSSRVLLLPDGEPATDSITKAVTLQQGEEWCDEMRAYVKPNIKEKLAPIQVSVNYNLVLPENPVPQELDPVLGYASQEVAPKQVFILNNCKDNICVPDLVIQSAKLSTSTIIVGSDENIVLNIQVDNIGEDAFQASLQAHIPDGLQFVRVDTAGNVGFSVTCNNDETLNVINCDLGNPLFGGFQFCRTRYAATACGNAIIERHKEVLLETFQTKIAYSRRSLNMLKFGLTLSTGNFIGDSSELEFYLMVSSQNEEEPENMLDNTKNITAMVEVQANIRINNASNPEQVHFYPADTETEVKVVDIQALNQIGPVVEHIYDIRNDGPSVVGKTRVDISWPLYDLDGNYVLYSLSVQPSADCEIPPNFNNPEGLPQYPPTMEPTTNTTYSTTTRRRRQTLEPQTASTDCSTGKCVTFTCTIRELRPGLGYGIRIMSRFWNQTFITSGKARIEISSTAQVQVQSMPYTIARPPFPSVSGTVITTAFPAKPLQAVIPWWVILVAILIGLLLLLLLIVLMWKCGFFRRKRVDYAYHQAAVEDNENDAAAPMETKVDPPMENGDE